MKFDEILDNFTFRNDGIKRFRLDGKWLMRS